MLRKQRSTQRARRVLEHSWIRALTTPVEVAMSHVPMPQPSPGSSPWRLLILDRDPDDPLWVVATVTLSSDVKPASLDAVGRYTAWQSAIEWTEQQVGHKVELVPVHDPLVWRIDGRRPQ